MEENIITKWAKTHELQVNVYYNETIPYKRIKSYGRTYWGFTTEYVNLNDLIDLQLITKASNIQITSEDNHIISVLVTIRHKM